MRLSDLAELIRQETVALTSVSQVSMWWKIAAVIAFHDVWKAHQWDPQMLNVQKKKGTFSTTLFFFHRKLSLLPMHYVREIQTTTEILIALIINLLTLEKHFKKKKKEKHFIICIYVALLKKKGLISIYIAPRKK